MSEHSLPNLFPEARGPDTLEEALGFLCSRALQTAAKQSMPIIVGGSHHLHFELGSRHVTHRSILGCERALAHVGLAIPPENSAAYGAGWRVGLILTPTDKPHASYEFSVLQTGAAAESLELYRGSSRLTTAADEIAFGEPFPLPTPPETMHKSDMPAQTICYLTSLVKIAEPKPADA